jgi:hypothetical protein
MQVKDAKILILCKTYPTPSGKHAETSCVAGMDEEGNLIRLYPVPFRLITKDQQFKKWQWISTKVRKAKQDHRPESHNILVDTIALGKEISPERNWEARRRELDKLRTFSTFADIAGAQKDNSASLALLRPRKIISLEIVPVSKPEWTEDELAKLLQEQKQGGLFTEDKPSIRTLRKLPYDFYYRYECETPNGVTQHRHMITDWEIGALFWNCQKSHGVDWEKPFRDQLEIRKPNSDLMFLMGNQHRFQDQWLIISLIYPPHKQQETLVF